MVPDAVGLFCVAAAKSGGVSRFCSLYAVHQRLEQQYPEALTRLYQPMLYDRQKEHGAHEPPVTWAPFFSWRGDRLFARANPSLVRKGYEVAGQAMDPELYDALDAVDSVSASEDLWYEAALEPGQIQYLNNHEIGHYRSEFVDHDDLAKRRSLYRLWHRADGTTKYHGV
jgi:alpha-ketoglutarate-dependent taurine dioxygenase